MTGNDRTAVTVLGLGQMGRVLAARLVEAGHPTTVWNRSPGKAGALAERETRVADTAGAAVAASPLVVSVEQGVDPQVIEPVQAMIRRQIAAGHGKEGFARIYEEIRRAA